MRLIDQLKKEVYKNNKLEITKKAEPFIKKLNDIIIGIESKNDKLVSNSTLRYLGQMLIGYSLQGSSLQEIEEAMEEVKNNIVTIEFFVDSSEE